VSVAGCAISPAKWLKGMSSMDLHLFFGTSQVADIIARLTPAKATFWRVFFIISLITKAAGLTNHLILTAEPLPAPVMGGHLPLNRYYLLFLSYLSFLSIGFGLIKSALLLGLLASFVKNVSLC